MECTPGMSLESVPASSGIVSVVVSIAVLVVLVVLPTPARLTARGSGIGAD